MGQRAGYVEPINSAALWPVADNPARPGILFIEASARTGINVEAAFDQAARDILRKIQQGVFDKGPSPGVKTGKPRQNTLQMEGIQTNSGCC